MYLYLVSLESGYLSLDEHLCPLLTHFKQNSVNDPKQHILLMF